MKRITIWLVSLVLATVITFVLFEFTPIAIPFIEGGGFTLISIIFMAILIAIPLDSITKAGILDERGVHFGPISPGPLTPQDPKPPADYQPIVSREERLKQEQKQPK